MDKETKLKLAKKLAFTRAKNKIKEFEGKGIEVLEIFEKEQNLILQRITSHKYYHLTSAGRYPAYSKMPEKTPLDKMFQWIVNDTHMSNGKEYFYVCGVSETGSIWARIRITNLYQALKSLWNDNLFLIDIETEQLFDAGFYSGDEYNYQLFLWHADMIREIKGDIEELYSYSWLWNENREDYVLIDTGYGYAIVNKIEKYILWIADEEVSENVTAEMKKRGNQVFDCLKNAYMF